MQYKIIKFFPNSNEWNEGDIVDITDAKVLLEQGLVEEYVEKSDPEVPVSETEVVEQEVSKPKRKSLKEMIKKIIKK